MTNELPSRVASFTVPAKVLALFTFLGALFLEWQRVSVEVAGPVGVEETSIGWNGWGFVAGVLALALLTLWFVESFRSTAGELVGSLVLPFAFLLATALAVFTGDAQVSVARAVAVEVDSTLWPAWLGLALAALAAGAYLVEWVARHWTPRTTRLARPTPA